MPRPHPLEFRQRAVELARLREKPIAQIASDLGMPCARLGSTKGFRLLEVRPA